MQWMNDTKGYGWLAIALHWAAAIAVITLLYVGMNAHLAEEAGNRETHRALMGLHIAIGALVLPLLLVRAASSYAQTRPAPFAQAPMLAMLSAITHQALLIAILIQIISGPLAVWSGGRAINVFDWFSLPSPFAQRNSTVHEIAEVAHNLGRWVIIAALALHILGAVKHVVIDRDGVMRRMLAPAKS